MGSIVRASLGTGNKGRGCLRSRNTTSRPDIALYVVISINHKFPFDFSVHLPFDASLKKIISLNPV